MAGGAPLALVTGAAGGIGAGVGMRLAERGYQVIAVELTHELAERAAAQIGRGALAVASDATDRDQLTELTGRIRGEWADRLEVIVANAGLIVPGPVAQATPAQLSAQVEVMLAAPVQVLAAGAQVMQQRGRGHLLATVSMGAILPLPGSAAYSAAKAGLRAFLAALSAELRGSGVAVTGIYPSGVDTAMLRHEARHGGSMLNFVGDILSIEQVVAAYDRALDRRQLEVYLPWSDSLLSRVLGLRPALTNRILPLFDRLGRRGHAEFLARIEAEEEEAEAAKVADGAGPAQPLARPGD